MKTDFQGKAIVALHDVRGALVSASASLTTGTATSLITGDAANFLDIVEMTFANNSSASAAVALVSDGSTIRTLQIPASTTIQIFFDAPLKQQTKNTPWIVDMEDITGTTVTVGATLIFKTQ